MSAAPDTHGLAVRPLGTFMAAEVTGVDLSVGVAAETCSQLNRAFLEHLVLCVRGQSFEPQQYLAASRLFGDPQEQLVPQFRHESEPLISVVSSADNRDTLSDGKPIVRGPYWHTDDSFFERPAKATVLYAVEVPEDRGDTWFANMYSAYEALDEETKTQIRQLRAVHKYVSRRAGAKVASLSDEDRKKTPAVSHPLVRTHPETGRKALYLNPNRIDHIEGMSLEKSDALLDRLYDHVFDGRFHYRHRWRKGDMLIWDNRCTMHRASSDLVPGTRRVLHRVLLKGTRPA